MIVLDGADELGDLRPVKQSQVLVGGPTQSVCGERSGGYVNSSIGMLRRHGTPQLA
jgi:hypothetical protein